MLKTYAYLLINLASVNPEYRTMGMNFTHIRKRNAYLKLLNAMRRVISPVHAIIILIKQYSGMDIFSDNHRPLTVFVPKKKTTDQKICTAPSAISCLNFTNGIVCLFFEYLLYEKKSRE